MVLIILIAALPARAAQLVISIHHTVGSRALLLDSAVYQNELAQAFTISKFKYYLSDFSLLNTSGKFIKAHGYYLVDEEDSNSRRIVLNDIPNGDYLTIRFIVGVDSLHNCSGAQDGALDPVHGMFWAWNTGYIFLKLEGHSVNSTAPGQLLEYHIGGYKAPAVCMRTVNLEFDTVLKVGSARTAKIEVKANVLTMLSIPAPVDFSQLPSVTDYHHAEQIADGYARMFTTEQ